MTRETFDTLFVQCYPIVGKWACKRIGEENGWDCVHHAYANIIEHKTYKPRTGKWARPKYTKWWIFLKVAREVSLFRKRERARQLTEVPYIDERPSS